VAVEESVILKSQPLDRESLEKSRFLIGSVFYCDINAGLYYFMHFFFFFFFFYLRIKFSSPKEDLFSFHCHVELGVYLHHIVLWLYII
jgi:hypothetical protein